MSEEIGKVNHVRFGRLTNIEFHGLIQKEMDSELYFTISPMGPSTIERLKETCEKAELPEVLEGMSAASIIAMAAPEYYPLRNTAAQDLRDLLEKRDRMEALTAEWVTIPYTGNVGVTERLIDPG